MFQKYTACLKVASFHIQCTAKNTAISPNFLVWKFFEKAQFTHSFGRFAYDMGKVEAFLSSGELKRLCPFRS